MKTAVEGKVFEVPKDGFLTMPEGELDSFVKELDKKLPKNVEYYYLYYRAKGGNVQIFAAGDLDFCKDRVDKIEDHYRRTGYIVDTLRAVVREPMLFYGHAG